jgi:hypothetical protein
VTVGGGGPGATAANTAGTSGSNSTFVTFDAVGGGGGGGNTPQPPITGGSGGGAGTNSGGTDVLGAAGTAGQGNAGGSVTSSTTIALAGGGGGAGAAGQDAVGNTNAGSGGAGSSSSITGTSLFYAGGGGGASGRAVALTAGVGGTGGGGAGGGINESGTAGTDGLGGGGGGGSRGGNGGDGGDGVVIIRYLLPIANWTPEPQVTLDGIDYTANTIGNVSIRRGRDTVYAQVQAGYATVELIDVNGLIQPKVGQTLVVSARDAYDVQTPLFTGQVSDWDTETVAVQDGVLVTYRMQAVGPLARLNRRTILFDGRPSELDGARVGVAVAEGLSSAWEEVAGTVTWGSVGTAVTYDTFDPNYDADLIDPGVFTLAALGSADSGYTALQVAQDAASSGQGVMFETAAGLVGYADADRRQTAAQNDLFVELPFGSLSVGGLSVSSQFADVTNRVTVDFEGGSVTETFSESVEVFGEVLASSLSTIVVDQSAAEQFAETFLERHSERSRQLGRISFNLRGVSPELRNLLLSVNTGSPVVLTGVPDKVGFTRFAGFVEGVDFLLDEFRAEVGLLVSEESLSTGAVRWSVVPRTLEWGDVDVLLEWQDARSVA